MEENSKGVQVTLTDGRRFTAPRVGMATPAPITKALVKNPSRDMRAALNTEYATTAVINIKTKSRWPVPGTVGSHSAAIPLRSAREGSLVVAFTIETGKGLAVPDGGELFGVHLDGAALEKFQANYSDKAQLEKAIFAKVVNELTYYFTGKNGGGRKLSEDVDESKSVVQMWPYATSVITVKSLAPLRRLTDGLAQQKIMLLGDQVTFSSLSAVGTSAMNVVNAITGGQADCENGLRTKATKPSPK